MSLPSAKSRRRRSGRLTRCSTARCGTRSPGSRPRVGSTGRFIASIPKVVVALLLVAAIVNLLIGVFLRYILVPVTDWLDVDPIRFTWVEEVGEMMLAWLALVGAAIAVRERNHFTLHVLRRCPTG